MVSKHDWLDFNIGKDATLKARIGWQGLTTSEYLDSGDYILVTGTDFENGQVGWETCHFVDAWRYEQDKNIQLKTNDVLITKDGTIGKVGFVDTLDLPATLNSGIFVIRPKNTKLDQKFLYYVFTSKVFEDFLNKLTAGSTINHLYQKDFIHFSFKAPKPQEQKAIAQSLSDTDELITSLGKLIAKKEVIKQGTMQQLLTGKKRLAGFSGEWEKKRLGKLLYDKPKYGINAPATKLEGDLPNYLRITDITDDGFYSKIDRVGVNHTMSDLYQLYEGDIVLARTGASVGKSYLYNENDGKLIYAGFLIKISPIKEQLNPSFLFQYLKTHNYWKWVQVMSMRSGQPGINGNEYSSMLIPVPPKPEQQAISKILAEMDDEIEMLKTKLSKTKAIKEAMMSELLTGKTKLTQGI